ncbi:transcriptional regulator [Rubellicoccus peritrichatus]|uniref:Transcriptional regulator n=1 Tax=Rubellicoccus peritrichatus TaxID=3080537 RepID=A0AAQ3LJ41_9BACT|nr:transcriptional regulator [Puniceicoccus sp. CR14]WOO43099.1 transcriptional regulator [Puniceicoccus sp. CR14]
MSKKNDNPFDELHRVLHEPKRLAIISSVAGSKSGLTFGELKELGDLTDGNLNRHLRMLEDEKIIKLKKILAEGRARTVVTLTASGKKRFLAYLGALESILKDANKSVKAGQGKSSRGMKLKMA